MKIPADRHKKKKPGFITSTYVWERNDRDCIANIWRIQNTTKYFLIPPFQRQGWSRILTDIPATKRKLSNTMSRISGWQNRWSPPEYAKGNQAEKECLRTSQHIMRIEKPRIPQREYKLEPRETWRTPFPARPGNWLDESKSYNLDEMRRPFSPCNFQSQMPMVWLFPYVLKREIDAEISNYSLIDISANFVPHLYHEAVSTLIIKQF